MKIYDFFFFFSSFHDWIPFGSCALHKTITTTFNLPFHRRRLPHFPSSTLNRTKLKRGEEILLQDYNNSKKAVGKK